MASLGPSSLAFMGTLVWLFLVGLSIAAVFAFFRAVRALEEIPRRLKRIEELLEQRASPGRVA